VRACNGRDSPIDGTTFFLSVVLVNLQLGCVGTARYPFVARASGRRVYTEKSCSLARTGRG
jgi:hypothetical protein